MHLLSTQIGDYVLPCIHVHKYAEHPWECLSVITHQSKGTEKCAEGVQDFLQSLQFSQNNDIIDLRMTQGKTAAERGISAVLIPGR